MTNQRPKNRVMISTIAPISGGVPTMLRFICHTLSKEGYEPVIAHYQPYSLSPALSVPVFKLLVGSVKSEIRKTWGDYETHAVGAWLPELEFTHYFATAYWRKIMDSCDAFISVSGNVLAATPYRQTGRPFLAWVATDWEGDRKERVRRFSWLRKWLDGTVNRFIIKRLEKKLLTSGHILALSDYTAGVLKILSGNAFNNTVLSMPVDADRFKPCPDRVVAHRIGFTGRIDDPRKNIGLLLEAAAVLNAKGERVTILLIGARPSDEIRHRIERLGLHEQITCIPHLSRTELCAYLQTLDVFVLPSHQEGLCISALEAMSCGIPVISTRCGGPEEFVIPEKTGMLVDFDVQQMAQAIRTVVSDRTLRAQLSQGARQIVEERYTPVRAERIFWDAFNATFPAFSDNQEPLL
ncbi:MAG: glycosyltransferase family 4 protein [Gammaproteobacteria bacterium]